MNALLKRSVTGTAYVFLMALAILIHPCIFYFAFATALFILHKELYKLIIPEGFFSGIMLNFFVSLTLFTLLFLIAWGWVERLYLLLLPTIPLIFFISQIFLKNRNPAGFVSQAMFGFIYISIPVGLLSFFIFPDFQTEGKFYPWILFGILLITWIYDTGAYFIGSWIGKHKLAKEISPGKSWEGVIGGGIIAFIVSIFIAVLFQEPGLITWIGIAIIAIIFGTLGDLFESRLKRNAGIKDTGNLLPGHGGLLDRFDSLLFIIPPALFWIMIAEKFN